MDIWCKESNHVYLVSFIFHKGMDYVCVLTSQCNGQEMPSSVHLCACAHIKYVTRTMVALRDKFQRGYTACRIDYSMIVVMNH